jgi:hypothetical protein
LNLCSLHSAALHAVALHVLVCNSIQESCAECVRGCVQMHSCKAGDVVQLLLQLSCQPRVTYSLTKTMQRLLHLYCVSPGNL